MPLVRGWLFVVVAVFNHFSFSPTIASVALAWWLLGREAVWTAQLLALIRVAAVFSPWLFFPPTTLFPDRTRPNPPPRLQLVINMGGEMLYILRQRLDAQSIAEEKSKKGTVACSGLASSFFVGCSAVSPARTLRRLSCARCPLSRAVLADVVRAMFDPTFLAELFRPQDVYTSTATRHIFDKLAHTSIMRLNENSMDKVPSGALHDSTLHALYTLVTGSFTFRFPTLALQLYDLMTMGFKHQILSCTSPAQLLQVTLNHMESVRGLVSGNPVEDLVEDAIAQFTTVLSTDGSSFRLPRVAARVLASA